MRKANGRRFTVTYERDESGAWLASVAEVAGCHTYGRTLAQARERIREALEVSLDDPSVLDGAEFIETPRLKGALARAVKSARAARERAESVQSDAQARLREAVRGLTGAGVSVRDAAELLGVSHQRVHQLAH